MNRKIINILIILGVLVAGVVCVGMWQKNDGAIVAEWSDEAMDEFLDSYAEMSGKGEQENVLTVISSKQPEAQGAIDVVEGPNQMYYIMYDSAETRDEAYRMFSADDSVKVEKNIKMDLMEYGSWGIWRMGLDKAIVAIGNGGAPVKVAVIDTGLDVGLFQENFADRVLMTYDVENNTYEASGMVDNNGHGTHVAGIVAEGTPKNVSIYAIRASRGKKDELYSNDVTTAIYKAVNEGAKVINMSFGAYTWIDSQKLALDYARDRGVITVAAAGNDGKSDILYPAGYDNTLSISAVNFDYTFAEYSNYGETVDFAAPGTYILGINGYMSGTSMATPHMAAAVAILKSYNSAISFDDAKSLLMQHTKDLGEEGKDSQFGYGFVDLGDARFCGGRHCDEYGVFELDGMIEPTVVDYTGGKAEVSVLNDGVIVAADEACVVMVSQDDGGGYERAPATRIDGSTDSYKFEFEATDATSVLVVLRGDGDLDSEVTSADANMINRSLISHNLRPYRALSDLEELIFDLDNDGNVTSADSNLISRSLISPNLKAYKEISW